MTQKNRDAAGRESGSEHSRRDFVAMSAAVGLAAASGASRAAQASVMAMNVNIKTPDGVCDAALFHPNSGTYPGVLLWSDAFGLRPTTYAMGKRLAAEGYVVLVPNPFYRTSKAPQYDDVSKFNFQDPAQRSKMGPLMQPLQAPGAAERDAAAYIAYLDSQSAVNKSKKIGTQGYCMGGPLIMKTAAALPDRVGAAASFHGGGLVTNMPDSPHLLAPKIKAQMYFGVAASDDKNEPDAKDKLRAALAAAGVKAEIEVYPNTLHGWCMSDMPKQGDQPIYNQADAERAWGKLLALYKVALA
jgi:carboxymethylenebutenolidase